MVNCKICNKKFKRITATHLKQHNTTVAKYVKQYGKEELFDDYLRVLYDTASKKSFIRRHGEEKGITKYDEYVKFHSFKNSFEYKRDTLGWTKEQYDIYNKSRAVTKELCIERHGKLDGEKLFNEYKKQQQTNGCKLEYFISKYGKINGKKKYEELGKKKSHMPYNNNSSKKATEFISTIYTEIKNLNIPDIYCNYKDMKEFFQYDKENNRYFFYDLTIPSLNICIEFNGDYWHANPNRYSSDFKVRQKLASEIWKYDEEKLNLIRKKNIEVFIVWEDEYDTNNKKCTRRIIDEIKRRI